MDRNSTSNAPMSSATLHILVALAGGNLHGYGIIKEVSRSSNYRLGPGTLYDNLKKLMDAGLVADAPKAAPAKRRAASAQPDDRRFYTLTREGEDALTTEVERLESVLTEARFRLQQARPRRA